VAERAFSVTSSFSCSVVEGVVLVVQLGAFNSLTLLSAVFNCGCGTTSPLESWFATVRCDVAGTGSAAGDGNAWFVKGGADDGATALDAAGSEIATASAVTLVTDEGGATDGACLDNFLGATDTEASTVGTDFEAGVGG
jgi:hypothetical protein